MDYTMNEKYRLIKKEILNATGKNPIEIAKSIMFKGFISIHGPEHHYLDGASLLAAYNNAGGNIDLNKALESLEERTIKMPGAMCGLWGVCGSATSVGAALSIICKTTPLSSTNDYKNNMELTSLIISRMSEIGGPRCCKRNAFISLSIVVGFIKEKYNIEMEIDHICCEFSSSNTQCIGLRCPFYRSGDL